MQSIFESMVGTKRSVPQARASRPGLLLLGCSHLSRRAGLELPAPQIAARFAPAFVPVGLGIWFAHSFFHFAIGGLTIVPVLQSFLLDHGLRWLGTDPRWDLGYLLPPESVFPIQVIGLTLGYFGGLGVLAYQALRTDGRPMKALVQLLPWALILTALALASLGVFNLPMEMRGAFGA